MCELKLVLRCARRRGWTAPESAFRAGVWEHKRHKLRDPAAKHKQNQPGKWMRGRLCLQTRRTLLRNCCAWLQPMGAKCCLQSPRRFSESSALRWIEATCAPLTFTGEQCCDAVSLKARSGRCPPSQLCHFARPSLLLAHPARRSSCTCNSASDSPKRCLPCTALPRRPLDFKSQTSTKSSKATSCRLAKLVLCRDFCWFLAGKGTV